MRKKIILLLLVVVVVLAGVFAGGYINKEKEMAERAMAEVVPPDEYRAISVTAVGDCTFGTDVNYLSDYSFDAEFERQNGDATYFLRKVRRYFENDDLTIVNFEGTLSENGERADKEFAFRGNPEYARILTSSSVEAANLANNHSRDYGDVSFSDTKKILEENKILCFEGKNYGIRIIDGIKIGMIGTSTMRFDGEAGFIKRMEELNKENPDLIIASFHWGEEGTSVPNEQQKTLARLAIDNGADLVIGHHPHVLQGVEKYNGKYILYSLGNFCFGGNKHPVDRDTMIFKQTFIFKNGALADTDSVHIIPCSVTSANDRNNFQPIALSGDAFLRVVEKIKERSADFTGIGSINFISE